MSCCILSGDGGHPGSELACFFCNTVDVAFGPVMYGGRAEAVAFMEWLRHDPRTYSPDVLEQLYVRFRKEVYPDDDA